MVHTGKSKTADDMAQAFSHLLRKKRTIAQATLVGLLGAFYGLCEEVEVAVDPLKRSSREMCGFSGPSYSGTYFMPFSTSS